METKRIALDEANWKVRLFFWSLGVCGKFTGYENNWKYTEQTNLCHFMRVICFYMPLVVVMHLLLAAGTLAVAVVMPIDLFGVVPCLYVLGGLAALVLVITGLGYGFNYLMYKKSNRQEPELVAIHRLKKKELGPSFFDLAVAYLKAGKAYVCPSVSFTGRKEAARA